MDKNNKNDQHMISKRSIFRYYLKECYPFDTVLLNELAYDVRVYKPLCINKVYISVQNNCVYIGNHEPDYVNICLHRIKEKSYILTGFYSKSRLRYYSDTSCRCKFKSLIDKYWEKFYAR